MMQARVFDAFPIRISPGEGRFSCRGLFRLFETLREESLELNSLLLLRGGKLAFEYYAHPYGPQIPRDSFSAVKSFISLAVGLVTNEGLLDIEEKVVDVFPEYRMANPSDYLQEMTVKHLLTSSTGHDGDALRWFPDDCDDIVQWFLDLEVPFEPGSQCRIENPTFLILERIVARRAGRSVQHVLIDDIFSKIGMGHVDWVEIEPDGLFTTLRATPLDYARIGLLLYNGGQWGDQLVIPKNWIQAATAKHIAYPEGLRASFYGYLFWCDNLGGFSAVGDHGQRIIVIPERDLIVVMTGTEPEHGRIYDHVMQMLACDYEGGDGPSDERALTDLLTEMDRARPEPRYMPRTAYDINGETYTFVPQQYFAPTELTLHFADGETFRLDIGDGKGRKSTLTGSLNGEFLLGQLPPDNFYSGYRDAGTEVAARGRWTSDSVFECEIRPLRYGMCHRYVATFHGRGLHLNCRCHRRQEALESQ